MKLPRYLCFTLWITLCAAPIQAAEAPTATTICNQVQSLIHEGDVLFVRSEEEVFQRVASTTGGWTNHVGIAFQNPKSGKWQVSESTLPKSTQTALCTFIADSSHQAVAVRRSQRKFSDRELSQLKREAAQRMNIEYDEGFDFDSALQYCSKFVYQVIHEATGIELGTIETFQDLMDRMRGRPEYDQNLDFWKRWFEGPIPLKQRVISPQSQYTDPSWITVYENLFRDPRTAT